MTTFDPPGAICCSCCLLRLRTVLMHGVTGPGSQLDVDLHCGVFANFSAFVPPVML